ncbi:MAG TPA: RDD family protein [Vicinamibacterales bacterium]|jgi:uncharacterized RDD family membrane protein YckC
MTAIKRLLLALVCVTALVAVARYADAQPVERERRDPTSVTQTPKAPSINPPVEAQRPTPEDIDRLREEFDRRYWSSHHVAFRLGKEYVLRPGESVRDVIVVDSSATIEGFVRGDVTVALGDVKLGSTAVIAGSLFVFGGNLTVQPGAAVRDHAVIVGGSYEGPPDFSFGREHFLIDAGPLVDRVKAVVPWLTEGLLFGRPIVPRLGWVWTIVLIVFVLSLALNMMFLDGVRMCTQMLAARPLSTFLVGLLVLLLAGPVSVVLIASVVGLAVVPFLIAAIVIAWTVGKIGVSLWIGGSMIGQPVPETRVQSAVMFTLGFATICVVYMVPILGFIVWGLVGVLGLGSATLAFMTAYRRENPARPKPAPAPRGDDDMPPSPRQPETIDPIPLDTPPIERPIASAPVARTVAAGNAALFPRASFGERIVAFALDVALVLIINGAFRLVDDDGGPFALLLAYHIIFWTWKGATVGDIIMQLRVVRVTGEPLRFGDALVRGLASVFSILILGLGMFWILRDPERQAWHDKIAGTYVVKVPPSYALS